MWGNRRALAQARWLGLAVDMEIAVQELSGPESRSLRVLGEMYQLSLRRLSN